MDQKELKLILQEGEGYKIEFKESISNIEKEIVAFANSSGGIIVLGITDNKRIKGLKITNDLKSKLQDIANNCQPHIKIKFKELKNILILIIKEGEDKPYKCSSGFYVRIGPNSQKLTRNEIIELFKSEGKIRFDELIEPKFDFKVDFDKEKLNRFLNLAGITQITNDEKVIENLGVAEKRKGKVYFNNTGILFFSKEPQKIVPWSVFTVVLLKDEKGVNIIDRKEISGSLFDIVYKVIDFVKLYTKVAYRFTGKPQREYPMEAVREAVINSVMHRDYFEHGHNNILKFFPNRLTIENYWLKPKDFKLGKTIFRRNHIISDLFLRIHFGERIGTGIQRMKDICKRENAPYPKIEISRNYFFVKFKQSKENLKIYETEKVREKYTLLNERQTRAIDHVKKQGYITISEYISLNKVSDKTARRDLNKLIDLGIFMKKGITTGLKFELRSTSVNFGQNDM